LFNSLLYGYGLTLFTFDKITPLVDDSNPCKKYLNFNTFINDFFNAHNHQRILRRFNKYFDLHTETNEAHYEARNFLIPELPNILSLGFERWVSKNLFDKKTQVPMVVKIYAYILYNYWYNMLHQEILENDIINSAINKISEKIISQITEHNKIYTTNFDNLLDSILKPQHIHGRFIIPLKDLDQIIIQLPNNIEFEYSFLFGTSGIEKAERLTYFSQISQDFYDLDFFYNNKLELEHLLIFGLSFSKAEVITNEFLRENPQYEELYLAKSVDGHILLILKKLYDENRINKITISYHNKSELDYYEELFQFTNFGSIINYIDFKDVYFN